MYTEMRVKKAICTLTDQEMVMDRNTINNEADIEMSEFMASLVGNIVILIYILTLSSQIFGGKC